MSYTKTVIAISRGDDYSFEELISTTIPFESKVLSKHELTIKELSSIYSVIQTYVKENESHYSIKESLAKIDPILVDKYLEQTLKVRNRQETLQQSL